jgi:hypothetical protein
MVTRLVVEAAVQPRHRGNEHAERAAGGEESKAVRISAVSSRMCSSTLMYTIESNCRGRVPASSCEVSCSAVTFRRSSVVDSNSSNRFAAGSMAVMSLAGLRSAILVQSCRCRHRPRGCDGRDGASARRRSSEEMGCLARFSNSSAAPNCEFDDALLSLHPGRPGRPRRLVSPALVADLGDQYSSRVEAAPERGDVGERQRSHARVPWPEGDRALGHGEARCLGDGDGGREVPVPVGRYLRSIHSWATSGG